MSALFHAIAQLFAKDALPLLETEAKAELDALVAKLEALLAKL